MPSYPVGGGDEGAGDAAQQATAANGPHTPRGVARSQGRIKVFAVCSEHFGEPPHPQAAVSGLAKFEGAKERADAKGQLDAQRGVRRPKREGTKRLLVLVELLEQSRKFAGGLGVSHDEMVVHKRDERAAGRAQRLTPSVWGK